MSCLAEGESREGLPPNLTLLPCHLRLPGAAVPVPAHQGPVDPALPAPDPGAGSGSGSSSPPPDRWACWACWPAGCWRCRFRPCSTRTSPSPSPATPGTTPWPRWWKAPCAGSTSAPSGSWCPASTTGTSCGPAATTAAKLELFRRGIDPADFHPRAGSRQFLRDYLGLGEGPVLLYTGRIAREKNLHLLKPLCEGLRRGGQPVNLVVAGDGPDLPELRQQLPGPGAGLTSRPSAARPSCRSSTAAPTCWSSPAARTPSAMSVLEAQACGLPAVVSDAGRPAGDHRRRRDRPRGPGRRPGGLAAQSWKHYWDWPKRTRWPTGSCASGLRPGRGSASTGASPCGNFSRRLPATSRSAGGGEGAAAHSGFHRFLTGSQSNANKSPSSYRPGGLP